MKIKVKCPRSQVCWLICLLFLAVSCNGKKEEAPVIPPLTSPLSQSYIGFGVVNVSYTRITARPEEDSPEGNASGGYLRRGSVVSILQRRLVKNKDKLESWVLVQGSDKGWLRESLVDIYDSELQARTASEAMGR
jgi:hypothetical protein